MKKIIFVEKKLTKEVLKKLKLYLPAQNASHNPTLNPTLGQAGINSMEFIKRFNEISKNYKANILLNVLVFVFIDKTFELFVSISPVSFLINEEIFKESGLKVLQEDNFTFGVSITLFNLYKVAYVLKKTDSVNDIISITKCLIGTARSMHCKIINL